MKWKIIFQLSLFGLIMAFATVALIPEMFEPVFWVLIFIFCAWVIAKVCTGNYFLHGFLVSMVNNVWITAIHAAFSETYVAHHPQAASIGANIPPYFAIHPQLALALMAPVFGVVFGIILGSFSFVAAKIVKNDTLR